MQFPCGIKLTVSEQSILNLINTSVKGDTKFINQLLLNAFGSDVLGVSSITGQSKKGNQISKLDPSKLECIRGIVIIKHKLYIIKIVVLSFCQQFCLWTVLLVLKMLKNEAGRFIQL
jgi:hypothetical protein